MYADQEQWRTDAVLVAGRDKSLPLCLSGLAGKDGLPL